MAFSLAQTWSLVKCTFRQWSQDHSATTGASLAFYCAFSLAPLLIIILTISGWIVGEELAYGQLKEQLTSLFGAATAATLLEAMRNSQTSEGGFAAIISVASLFLGATTVFAALENALEIIWRAAHIAPQGWKGWIRARLLSFGVILAVGFLLLISLTISTALTALRGTVKVEATKWVVFAGTVDLLLSIAIIAGLIALIYRFLPARRLPWMPILWGALVTALLFHLGKWAIALYLGHSTQPSAFGAAASFAALLLWLYYSAQIFLLGAEFTTCLAGVRKDEPRLDPGLRRDDETLSRSG